MPVSLRFLRAAPLLQVGDRQLARGQDRLGFHLDRSIQMTKSLLLASRQQDLSGSEVCRGVTRIPLENGLEAR